MNRGPRLATRVVLVCMSLVVWPIYYGGLVLKWMLPYWPFWSAERAREWDVSLYDQLRSPPFIRRLRRGVW